MINTEIRVFLDETRHLKNNPSPMVLGCVWGAMEDCTQFNKSTEYPPIGNSNGLK